MRSVLFLVLLVGASKAYSCGVCVEDKVAAVYDHAAVTRALEARSTVVFFHLDGTIPPGAAALRKIAAWPLRLRT